MAPTNHESLSSRPSVACTPVLSGSIRTDFYREELLKHWQCLQGQREHYSEKVIIDIKAALSRFHSEMGALCEREDGDQLVSRLLSKIDGVTRLSAWSDSKKHH